MTDRQHLIFHRALFLAFFLATLMPLTLALGRHGSASDDARNSEPWAADQTIEAADLVRELSAAKGTKPTVVYVGFRTLFSGGHIPGASFHGSASKPEGVEQLKKWANALPRATNLVIYCGCCPFDRCPNIRPAYKALHELGFTHLRVLVLPTSFAADWADKGYAIDKGL